MTVTQTMLVVVIREFESVMVSALPAASILVSLFRTPPIVFTVALALDMVVTDVVRSKPYT